MKIHLSYQRPKLLNHLPLAPAQIKKLVEFVWMRLERDRVMIDIHETFLGYPDSLNLFICDDVHMRTLQKTFRKLDRTTDILSFPTLELEGLAFEAADFSLGDLVISLETVERGAERGRRSVAEEFTEVLIHGMLHLVGLDHIKGRAAARRMLDLQSDIYRRSLKELKLARSIVSSR